MISRMRAFGAFYFKFIALKRATGKSFWLELGRQIRKKICQCRATQYSVVRCGWIYTLWQPPNCLHGLHFWLHLKLKYFGQELNKNKKKVKHDGINLYNLWVPYRDRDWYSAADIPRITELGFLNIVYNYEKVLQC